jgi:fumarate reductase flavoprotein subunit
MKLHSVGIQPDNGQWEIETDVVVIGGGGCGMAATLASAQGGAHTVLLEKMHRPLSNTARSGGMIPAAGTRFQRAAGIEETAEDFARDILEKNHHTADRDTVLHMARTSRALVEWLVDACGVKLELVSDFKYPGHTQFRMHVPPSRTGVELITDLKHAVQKHPNADLVEGASGIGLVVDRDGVVCGAIAEQGGEALRVKAKKVILACNGFGGNAAMVAKYIPEIEGVYYFGGEGSMGEGILWGEELGAELAFKDGYQCHSTVAMPGETLITYAVVMEGGFQLNKHGQRFGDETHGYSEHALEIMKQPALSDDDDAGMAQGRVWVVYDQRVHDIALAFDDYKAAVEVGIVKKADSVRALAQLAGIDSDEAERTFEHYQACARGEAKDPFGRSDCRRLTGPFYGVKVTAALFHTQGGLRVDRDARVLRPDQTPIPNLYAGGGCAAGISGHGPGGYLSGNGLLTALGYGLLAGRHAARSVRDGV